MMNALNTINPTPACVCGWNTPDHNADTYAPKQCPAVKAATKRLYDEGYSTTKQTRWSNYYVDPDDVTIVVLTALQDHHATALAALAESYEPEQYVEQTLADVIPIGVKQVKTSSSPLNLDPHEAYYRPPFTGHAA